jgi:CRP-like cAMP-binding protein
MHVLIYLYCQRCSKAFGKGFVIYLRAIWAYNVVMELMPESLAKVLGNARRKQVLKNQVLLYQGDVSPDVMVIKSGIVKVHDIDAQGNEKILHLLKNPAVFPLAFFTGGDSPTRWYYTALTDCEIYTMPKTKLRELLAHDPELSVYLMNWFSREVHEILTRLSSLSKTLARDKVIAALRFLAVLHSVERRSGWKRVTFPVSHQLLADMTGITRESATLTLKELQAEQTIRNPRITILEINYTKLCSD